MPARPLTAHTWACTRTYAHTHTHTRTTGALAFSGLQVLPLSLDRAVRVHSLEKVSSLFA